MVVVAVLPKRASPVTLMMPVLVVERLPGLRPPLSVRVLPVINPEVTVPDPVRSCPMPSVKFVLALKSKVPGKATVPTLMFVLLPMLPVAARLKVLAPAIVVFAAKVLVPAKVTEFEIITEPPPVMLLLIVGEALLAKISVPLSATPFAAVLAPRVPPFPT